MSWANTIMILLCVSLPVLFAAWMMIESLARRRRSKDPDAFDEPVEERRPATVVDKDEGLLYRNGHPKFCIPAHTPEFRVIFLLDDWKRITLSVDPEIYRALRIGMKGVLITLGGEFQSFLDQEEECDDSHSEEA